MPRKRKEKTMAEKNESTGLMTEKSRTAFKKRVSLADLLREGKPVWVRNNTHNVSQNGESGYMFIQVGSGSNYSDIKIPPGKDPICITDQVAPDALKLCNNLFELIRSGGLVLLDPEEAEQYYYENEDRKEAVEAKIQKLLHESKEEKVEPKEASTTTYELHPKVQDIVLKAKHKAISERIALEELLERSSAFRPDDFQYLMSNGVFNSVKKWAKESYNKLVSKELEE